MPLSKQHKARTRERILRSAGRVFRAAGYEAAGVDAVMAGAGLTRGGFYAHFDSKEELFAAVLAADHGLIRMLAAREAASPVAWRETTLQLLSDYLDKRHLAEVARDCSFAALTADARRGGAAVRQAYRVAFETLVAELLREHGESAAQAWSRASTGQRAGATQAAAGAIGALVVAAALGPGEAAAAVLDAAYAALCARMDGGPIGRPFRPPSPRPP